MITINISFFPLRFKIIPLGLFLNFFSHTLETRFIVLSNITANKIHQRILFTQIRYFDEFI